MTDDQGSPVEPPASTDTRVLSRGERFSATRDILLFLLGAAGFVHELLVRHDTERPVILLLCGTFMGAGKVLEVISPIFGGSRRES